jgi:xanthine phosphoribosyltransferase
MGLVRLVKAAGAELVGIGTLIEKTFEGGRDLLAELNVPVYSLVTISAMENGKFEFSESQ